MEVTYRLLDHKEPLEVAEIERIYDDQWVYIVNAEFSKNGDLIKGIPAVCGNCAYAGVETGIYQKLEDKKYGEHTELYLFKPELFTILEKMRAANV